METGSELFAILNEVWHDDQIDGPVADVEEDEHEGEDIGGCSVKA